MDHNTIGGATLGCEGGFDIGMGNVLVAGSLKVQRLGLAKWVDQQIQALRVCDFV